MKTIDLNKITQIVSTLAVVAILSMDLSVPYNKNEEKIYTNKYFQTIAVFSTVYQQFSQDLNVTIIVTFAWLLIKHTNLVKLLPL